MNSSDREINLLFIIKFVGADPSASNETYTTLSMALARGHTAVADEISRALNQ